MRKYYKISGYYALWQISIVILLSPQYSCELISHSKHIWFPSHTEYTAESLIWAVGVSDEPRLHDTILHIHQQCEAKNNAERHFDNNDKFVKEKNLDLADILSTELNLLNLGQVGDITGVYLFGLKTRAAEEHVKGNKSLTFKDLYSYHGTHFKGDADWMLKERLHVEEKLQNHNHVTFFSQQQLVSRVPRSHDHHHHHMHHVIRDIKDPYFKKQWHLVCV